jgi:phosphoribosyl-dephospho-CoA transferase
MTRPSATALRHHWVHVRTQSHSAVADSCRQPQHRGAIEDWLAAGHPLMLRSRAAEDPSTHLPAGFALPPAQGKARMALAVASDAVDHIEAPPELACLADALAAPYASLAKRLDSAARQLGFVARAFGSAAWQWRSGQPYMNAGSDIDVVASPPNADALAAWLACLEASERDTGIRIDGEVLIAGVLAVHWREWASGTAEVLVKQDAGPQLLARKQLEAAWSS